MLFTQISMLAASLLVIISLSSAVPTDTGTESLFRRQDDKCFATEFGINDFKTFSGGMKQPAYVSFGVASRISSDRAICSYRDPGSKPTPYFKLAVACKGTTKSTFFFTYEEGNVLTISEYTSCGGEVEGLQYYSSAKGSLPDFCYTMQGGELCQTPTGSASLRVTDKGTRRQQT